MAKQIVDHVNGAESLLYDRIVQIALIGDPLGRPNRNNTVEIAARCINLIGKNVESSSLVYRALANSKLINRAAGTTQWIATQPAQENEPCF